MEGVGNCGKMDSKENEQWMSTVIILTTGLPLSRGKGV